jgi:hypothetical protein
MNYLIALKNLPYEPEERQVIYVENHYDERINDVIKRNYEQLKWNFKQSNLEFIYIPMFFNDEETREKILYYAPYLTSDIMDKTELRSSYLLGYMSRPENREKIAPSLLYAPKKENDEWIFRGRFIDNEKDDRASVIQWFDRFISEVEECLAPDDDSKIRFHRVKDETSVSPQVEFSSSGLRDKKLEDLTILREQDLNENVEEEPKSLEDVRDEEVEAIISDLLKTKNKLRLNGMSLGAIMELIVKDEPLSKLLVTEDYRIILPDYNNMEIELTPLHKAIYFLFLNHPEGIRLKDLSEHHKELCNYYKQMRDREMTESMERSIRHLEEPTSNDINIAISKIRTAFENRFDEHLAMNYIITGKAGEPYVIALNRDLLRFEEEEE